MKILYFHQHFSTRTGSTGTRSYEFAQKLIEHGHQVTMVCGSYGMAKTGLELEPEKGIRRGAVDGIDVIEICLPYSNHDNLFKRSLIFLKYALKSIGIALKEDYDLLFATSTPLTASIPGIAMRLLKPRKKFVFEVRDLWPELPKAMGVLKNPFILWGMSILEKASYMAMNAGIGLSPGIQKGMQKRSSAQKEIVLIPNGCDLNIFRPSLPEDPASPIQFEADYLNCIFTGAHGMANGLDAVLDAASALLKQNRSDIKFHFIGDGKKKQELITRAKDEGLENCTFHDPVPKTELANIVRRADVGLMVLSNVPAFYYGTSPNKFFDYISSALPVINNYPGWLADMIHENKCGAVVPPADAEKFAGALIDMANSRDKLTEVGNNGRKLAEKQFNRDDLAEKFVNFLETVFNRQQ